MKNAILKAFYSLFLIIIITACSSQSLENYKEEGHGIIKALINELKAIHTRDDLMTSSPELTRLFNELGNVMVKAHALALAHPEQLQLELTKEDHELSDQLRVELNRIFRIEGGRSTIEKCQTESLQKLTD
jgi:hypothetical protein